MSVAMIVAVAMIVVMVCLGSHVDRHSIDWHTEGRILGALTALVNLACTEMDVRVGGRWTIVDRREGTDYKAIGEYLEVDRPRRLAFTFGMPQFSAEFARVTVEIAPVATGCALTLTHERLPWAAISETEKGWAARLDRLEASLGPGADPGGSGGDEGTRKSAETP